MPTISQFPLNNALTFKTHKMPNISIFKNFVNKVEDKPLIEILNDIKNGTHKTNIEAIRTNINDDNKDEADQLKKQLLAFTVTGTFTNGRSINKIETYSQYVILDIDKLSDAQLQTIVNLSHIAPYTYASFVSPSGYGIKIIVKVNATQEHHKEAYNQVVDYYEQALKIDIDTSGSDICRLCFMSYDEKCFIKEDADTFKVQFKTTEEVETNKKYSEANNNQLSIDELLDHCLKFTEQKEQYFEGNRNNFIYLFASNACRFGIQETDALNFCITNFDLNEDEINSSVKSAYKNNFQDFAKFAKFANRTNEETFKSEKKQSIDSLSLLTSTPSIPESVFNNLPELFKKGIEVLKDNREKDVFLTGALSIISGCLPNVTGLYGGKVVFPNLFSFLLAPPASGKGALTFAKMLADKYHQTVMSDSREAEKEFNKRDGRA